MFTSSRNALKWPQRPQATNTRAFAHPALRVDALPLDRGGLPDGPGAPQLGADLGVGDAHREHGQEIRDDHERDVVSGRGTRRSRLRDHEESQPLVDQGT